MELWFHFVPVAADLSDLLEHHARLEEDLDLYARISRNGRACAARRLRVEDELVHVTKRLSKALGLPLDTVEKDVRCDP
ncbi:hypothetical protein [Luteolibacter soli]|uniref:Uncharacterized protein n=1 Tax=Luteolibacter soli TaxID=3135280 RepID=A0ABU9B354_9BACT